MRSDVLSVKIVPEMTEYVLVGTLNLTQSLWPKFHLARHVSTQLDTFNMSSESR